MIPGVDRWRTGMAVVAAFAIGTASLVSALLAVDSIRASLTSVLDRRIGRTSHIITAHHGFFREALASAIAGAGAWDTCPLIALDGWLVRQDRPDIIPVSIYGVDDRFWAFHRHIRQSPSGSAALLSPGLAGEMGVAEGAKLLLRFGAPSPVPAGVLFGPKDSRSLTAELTTAAVLTPGELGEFSENPNQTVIRSVFVSLSSLQDILCTPGRVNTILLSTRGRRHESATIAQALRERARAEDIGVYVKDAGSLAVLVEADSVVLSRPLLRDIQAALSHIDAAGRPISSYFATQIRVADKSVPYSFIAGVDPAILDVPDGSVVLNDWTARQLQARSGDRIELEIPVWSDGVLARKSEGFRLDRVVPLKGPAAGPDLIPDYPGVSGAASMAEWKLPFPIDTSLIRRQDEEYWKRYGGIPKVFLNITTAERLWGGEFGFVTAVRAELRSTLTGGENPVESFRAAMHAEADPLELGFTVRPVRGSSYDPARMPVDLFVWCSILPVLASWALATVLLRETGFIAGLLFSAAGVLIGVAVSPLLASGMLRAVPRWWPGALAGVEPAARVSPGSLATGGLAAIAVAGFCVLIAPALSRLRPGWRLASVVLAITAFLPVAAAKFRALPDVPSAYNVIAQSVAPLIWNPADASNQRRLNIPPADTWYPFGMRTGEDMSRLNLFQPENPRLFGAPREFIEAMRGRPGWQRLQPQLPDGSIPAIVDRFSLAAVLHGKLGDVIVTNPASDHPVRLRIVGTMHEPALQGGIVVSEANFRHAFPDDAGYRFFLMKSVDPRTLAAQSVAAFAAYGFRAEPVAERVAGYHVIDDAYTSVFQALGGVALLIAAAAFGVHMRRASGRIMPALAKASIALGFGLAGGVAVILWNRAPVRDLWWVPSLFVGALAAAVVGAIASRATPN